MGRLKSSKTKALVTEKKLPKIHNNPEAAYIAEEIVKGNLHRENCFYCNIKLQSKIQKEDNFRTIDHIIPHSYYPKGHNSNKNHYTNLVVACTFCNVFRGTMNFFDFCEFAEKYIEPTRNNLNQKKLWKIRNKYYPVYNT